MISPNLLFFSLKNAKIDFKFFCILHFRQFLLFPPYIMIMTNDDNGDEEKGKEDDDDDADRRKREIEKSWFESLKRFLNREKGNNWSLADMMIIMIIINTKID